MESTTVSPNGAAGAANTHTLASPAAEIALDAMLATPFAEADPSAELPAEPDPYGAIPPVPDSAEPPAEDAADLPPDLPEGTPLFLPEGVTTEEPATAEAATAPAADPPDTQDDTLAQMVLTAIASTAGETDQQPDTQLSDANEGEDILPAPLAADLMQEKPWQVGDYAKYKDKYIIEITAIHETAEPGATTFDGYSVWVQADNNMLVQGKPLTGKPLSTLKRIEKVTTILKIKIGLELRQMAEYDRLALQHAAAAEKIQKTLSDYTAAKEAVAQLVPDAAKLTW